jgi:hypothetical protein
MYQNPSTGVYGIFYYTPVEKEKDIPPDWSEKGATGLSISINYLRPSFFALELMPEIETLCKVKNLLVLDPQDSEIGGEGKPKPCVASELIASWERNNLILAIPSAKQGNFLPPYLDREKSLYLWKYLRISEALQRKFGDDVFVPKMVVVKRHPNEPLKTAITWADGIPTVLHLCDIIIFQRIYSKGFLGIGKKEEIGVIKYDTLNKAIRQHLRTYTVKDPSVMEITVLYPNNAEKAREILMKLPLEGFEGFEGVTMDGFVDMKPEASK